MSNLGIKLDVDLNSIFHLFNLSLGVLLFFFFFSHHDEILEVSNFRKERFILAQHWRASGPLW